MKNPIMESVRHYENNDLRRSLDSFENHFIERFGASPLLKEVPFHLVIVDVDWERFIRSALKAAWSKKVSIGTVYEEMWNYYPGEYML